MVLQSIRILDSSAAPPFGNTKRTAANECGEDPKILLGLLQRAARLWPSNGITFMDEGRDQSYEFMTYSDLLEEAKVRILARKVKVDVAN